MGLSFCTMSADDTVASVMGSCRSCFSNYSECLLVIFYLSITPALSTLVSATFSGIFCYLVAGFFALLFTQPI